MTRSGQQIPTIVIYGDFNCPFSAVANARAQRLSAAGRFGVDWRCVEHDPSIGPQQGSLTAEQASAFEAELTQIGDLLDRDEPNRFQIPSRRLNTQDLNHTYAATPMEQRQALRSAFFDAYWFDDRDLTDDRIVSVIAATVAGIEHRELDDGSTIENRHVAATWQREWNDLPRPIVPIMILPDGSVSRGLGALARLASGSVSAPSPRRTASDLSATSLQAPRHT